jgi:hypothetical protein
MPEYRFLCPQCGKAFDEGTLLTVCPDCKVLLRSTGGLMGNAASAELANLPPQLDIAALMQRVLAEEPQEEAIDAALRQVLQKEHPQAAEALFTLLSTSLGWQQRTWGISRLEAATRMAEGRSEMHLSPEGKPELTSLYSSYSVQGLENLPPEQREQVRQQLEEAARTGRPITRPIVLTPPGGTKSRAVVWLAIIIALGLAACYCLF